MGSIGEKLYLIFRKIISLLIEVPFGLGLCSDLYSFSSTWCYLCLLNWTGVNGFWVYHSSCIDEFRSSWNSLCCSWDGGCFLISLTCSTPLCLFLFLSTFFFVTYVWWIYNIWTGWVEFLSYTFVWIYIIHLPHFVPLLYACIETLNCFRDLWVNFNSSLCSHQLIISDTC